MSICQFKLSVIPRSGLIKKHNKIPRRIIMDSKNSSFDSVQREFWNHAKVASTEIIKNVDKIIDRDLLGNSRFCYNWKADVFEIDDDAWIYLNKNTCMIEVLTFRVDTRVANSQFLLDIIEIAKKHDLLFADSKGFVLNPNVEEIRIKIRNYRTQLFKAFSNLEVI